MRADTDGRPKLPERPEQSNQYQVQEERVTMEKKVYLSEGRPRQVEPFDLDGSRVISIVMRLLILPAVQGFDA